MMRSGGYAVRRRWSSRVTVAVLLMVCALFWAVPPASASPPPADGETLTKVYVVKPPQDGGAPEILRSIAERTLGDPGRWAEIFALNEGKAQSDGGVLTDPADLRPGWILRLPKDASGPDVQLARDTAAPAGTPTSAPAETPADPPAETGAETPAGDTSAQPPADAVRIPLAAVLAVVGAILLGLLTAAVLARRRLGSAARAVGRVLNRLGDPVRRARRLRFRRALMADFAGDRDTPMRAARAVADLAARLPETRDSVHAVIAGPEDVTALLATTAAQAQAPVPWEAVGPSRWRLSPNQHPVAAIRTNPAPGTVPTQAFLVRAGVSDDGDQLFVNLSRLDGVLSLTGDGTVARDALHALLDGILRTQPELPVAILDAPGDAGVTLPAGTMRVDAAELLQQSPPTFSGMPDGGGTLKVMARSRTLRGLIVVPHAPTWQETERLLAVCDAAGLGWTGLVCGEVSGAHWRWHAEKDGSVTIPVLDVNVTVPAIG